MRAFNITYEYWARNSMNSNLIGDIRIDPKKPRPSESFSIEIFDKNGNRYCDQKNVNVYINGIPGAIQYLQYKTEGQRNILVRVMKKKKSESKIIKIQVKGKSLRFQNNNGFDSIPVKQDAMLHVTQSLTNPYEVTFNLGDSPSRIGDFSYLNKVKDFSLDTSKNKKSKQSLDQTKIKKNEKRAQQIQIKPTSLLKLVQNNKNAKIISTQSYQLRKNSFFDHLSMTRTTGTLNKAEFIQIVQNKQSDKTSSFEWDFGDGNSQTTKNPQVTHDYSDSLTAKDEILQFKVKCRVVLDNIEITRILTIYSGYVICKKHGTIAPLVQGDVLAKRKLLLFYGKLKVTNLESIPLKIEAQAITPIFDDENALGTPIFSNLTKPITLPPLSATFIGIYVPFDKLLGNNATSKTNSSINGFTVNFAGSDPTGKPVRFTHVFEITQADQDAKLAGPTNILNRKVILLEAETNQAIQNLLNSTTIKSKEFKIDIEKKHGLITISAARELFKGKNSELNAFAHNIIQTGLLPYQKLAKQFNISFSRRPKMGLKSSNLRKTQELETQTNPGNIQLGGECDPDNISDEERIEAEAKQLVCQITDEVIEKKIDGRFMNARKGDIILSPGGSGFIANILRIVSPPQKYSHSGIMTRNYDEITHSTASEERTMHDDYRLGWFGLGGDAIRPDILKYQWPGAITQSIENAIGREFEVWTDPENGEEYNISAFSPHAIGLTHNNSFEVVPPLVVKPDPMKETISIRRILRKVADEAANDGGRPDKTSKSHYRFYCFSVPSIGRTDSHLAPFQSGWAFGTYPSVCSSFIWRNLKKIGVHLETNRPLVRSSDLEPSDTEDGVEAEVLSSTMDGLYGYTAEERLEAAEWLFKEVHDMAVDEAGAVGSFLTDAGDDYGNQICNAFINDDTAGKDHDDWRKTEDASAVSPDNILLWDGPDHGGVYGYSEPLIYREPRKENYIISRWRSRVGIGTISGTVRLNGQPVSGAEVFLYDDEEGYTHSQSDGHYSLTVPFGNYLIKASKTIDGIFYSATENINLNSSQISMNVNIDLLPPSEEYRKVTLIFDFYGYDPDFGADEIENPGPQLYEIELGPDRLTNSILLEYKWGGEIRVVYVVLCTLLEDNHVNVSVIGWLFQGGSESTDDLEELKEMSLVAYKDWPTWGYLLLENYETSTSCGGIGCHTYSYLAGWADLFMIAMNFRNNN